MPPDAVAHVLRESSGAGLCPVSIEAALDVLKAPVSSNSSVRSVLSLA